MKKICSVILTIVASVALGLAVGVYCGAKLTGNVEQQVVLVAGIVSGVCYLLAIILAATVAYATKQRKSTSISLQKNDLVLQAGVEYIVKKRGTVRPGEYTLLATAEDTKTFTVRVNDYVKEYSHNTALILSEGDRISARSGNVILR